MQPNKRNVMDPDQARSMRKNQRLPTRNEKEDEADDEFQEAPDKAIEKSKKELKNTQIKAQIEYFGYVLEPFNMNNEKKYGNIDKDGFFVFDKDKEKDVRDPWLDALDQDPYKQGIHEKIGSQEASEEEDKEFKQINKKGKIDVKNQDFEKIQNNGGDEKKNEKISRAQMIELMEKLVGFLEKDQTPNQLIKKMRPTTAQKQHVFKKNIRKNKKDNKNNDNSMNEEENNEIKEKFHEIIEICDALTSNGCLEIYTQSKEEITEFLNEKLKKNIGLEQHFIKSDDEFKNDDDDESESESDEEADRIFKEIREKAKETD